MERKLSEANQTVSKMVKTIPEASLVRQRYAPFDGIRDIINIGNVRHLRHNKDKYHYVIYIVALILEVDPSLIRLFRYDGRQWEKDKSKGGRELIKKRYNTRKMAFSRMFPWPWYSKVSST
jgi:hypothetical protein